MQGLQGAGCRVQGAGCRVQGAGSRVQGVGCTVFIVLLLLLLGDIVDEERLAAGREDVPVFRVPEMAGRV